MEKASRKCDGKVEFLGVWKTLLPKAAVVGVAVGLGKVQSALLHDHEHLLQHRATGDRIYPANACSKSMFNMCVTLAWLHCTPYASPPLETLV